MIIQGDAFRLRQAEKSDIQAIFQWENDVVNWFVSDTLAPYTLADIEEFILDRNDIFMSGQMRMIIEDESINPIGCIDFFDFNPKNRRVGIGILIDEKHRGKGFGKKAVKLATIFALESLDVKGVYAEVAESNIGSQRIFEGCGYEKSGIKLSWLWDGDAYQNQIFYQRIDK